MSKVSVGSYILDVVDKEELLVTSIEEVNGRTEIVAVNPKNDIETRYVPEELGINFCVIPGYLCRKEK